MQGRRFYYIYISIAGVQGYAIEGRVACSIDWFKKDINSTLYNLVIFSGSFFIPIIIIISTNTIIFIVVRVIFNIKHGADNSQANFLLANVRLLSAGCQGGAVE